MPKPESESIPYCWIAACTVASFIVLFAFANRIDFHADEAIYLASVPISLKNDTGLFFNAWYWVGSCGIPTPYKARVLTAILSAIAVGCLTISFCAWFPKRRLSVLFLLPLSLIVSYQGIFLMLRMRPELSWLSVSTIVVAALSLEKRSHHPAYRFLAILFLILLPMNHRLSWIPCLCLGGYLVLFGVKNFGRKFTLIAIASMPVGVMINLCVRPMLLGESFQQAIAEFANSPDSPTRMDFPKFLHNVFWECSTTFRDTAAYRSGWDRLLPANMRGVVNHHAVANWLWCLGCSLPFFGNTWPQRYVLGVPSMVLLILYAVGYYNPTYFAIFAVFSLLGFVFVFFQTKGLGITKSVAFLAITISLLNGSSFLITRVVNHGRASIFSVERELGLFTASIPPEATIAIPERFQSITLGHIGRRFVIYKELIPIDVDFVVVDDYDFEMYKPFIADFVVKQRQIYAFLEEYQTLGAKTFPVYFRDRLFPELQSGQVSSRQGSWFFRHSLQYRVVVLANKRTFKGTIYLPASFHL